jgi:hypothetical protein
MKKPIFIPVLLAALWLFAGCKKEDKPTAVPPPKDNASSPATPAPKTIPGTAPFPGGRKTSFEEVTAQLDSGGTLFAYMAVDQWLHGLSTNLSQVSQVLLAMPGPQGEERENMKRGFELITRLVKGSGIEAITGVGLSAAQVAPDLYRSKLILHHPSGAGPGFLTSIFGRAPHPPRGQDLLPTNTAFAMFGDLDAAQLWQVVERELTQSGIPAAVDGARAWPEMFEKQTQIAWSKLLASLGGELGLMLTLDEAQQITLPGPGGGVQMPTPALLLAVKVNNDLLYERISSELKKNPQAVSADEANLKMCSMPLPLPIPLPLQMVVASSGDYFYFATSPDLVRTVQEVRQGKRPGVKSSAEFQNLTKHLPAEGNHFAYVGRRFGETVASLQQQALRSSGMPEEQFRTLQRLLGGQQPGHSLAIGAHTATGWQSVTVGSQESAQAALLLPTVGVTAIGAGLLLPAMAKAKAQAQTVGSVNQMKQIALAARLYANDHGDKLPPADTWCDTLKGELGNSQVLKAPSDGGPGACSYAYNAKLSGMDEGKVNPQTVMFFEAESGWNQHGGPELMLPQPRARGVFVIGFADGSVQQVSPERLDGLRWDP